MKLSKADKNALQDVVYEIISKTGGITMPQLKGIVGMHDHVVNNVVGNLRGLNKVKLVPGSTPRTGTYFAVPQPAEAAEPAAEPVKNVKITKVHNESADDYAKKYQWLIKNWAHIHTVSDSKGVKLMVSSKADHSFTAQEIDAEITALVALSNKETV